MKKIVGLLFLILLWSLPAHAQPLERLVSQRFEYGEMIYRQSTGDIYVLYTQSGTWGKYTSAQYGSLRLNPLDSPSNRISPRNGFGRLWYGFNTVRNRIGWAVLAEIGFETRVMFDAGNVYLWRIDGLIYQLQSDGTWRFAAAPPEEPEEVIIREFSVTPDTATIGDTLTIQWELSGTPYALIEIRTASSNTHLQTFDYQPVAGSVQWSLPETVDGDLIVALHAAQLSRAGHSPSYLWRRVRSEEQTVRVNASTETRTTHAAYQRFANGFMIWREDTGDVRVFQDGVRMWYGYGEGFYGDLPTNDLEIIAACDIYPVNAFAIVWGTIGAYSTVLGCPQAPEQGYTLTIKIEGDDYIYSLPDGHQINLSASSWSYGS